MIDLLTRYIKLFAWISTRVIEIKNFPQKFVSETRKPSKSIIDNVTYFQNDRFNNVCKQHNIK